MYTPIYIYIYIHILYTTTLRLRVTRRLRGRGGQQWATVVSVVDLHVALHVDLHADLNFDVHVVFSMGGRRSSRHADALFFVCFIHPRNCGPHLVSTRALAFYGRIVGSPPGVEWL